MCASDVGKFVRKGLEGGGVRDRLVDVDLATRVSGLAIHVAEWREVNGEALTLYQFRKLVPGS